MLRERSASRRRFKQEESLLKGVWQVRVFENDGHRATTDEDKETRLWSGLFDLRWRFKSDRALMVFDSDDDEYGRYKLDVKANPKTVDIEIQGQTIRGIYRLETDKFIVCFSVKVVGEGRGKFVPGKEERPKEFSAKKGSERMMFVFVREKGKM